MIFNLIVKNGDLNLISDRLIIGLGGGFKSLHKYLESVKDVTGSAWVVKTYTGSYKSTKITTIAIAGGGVYAEWIAALAYKKRAKLLVGVGWCGALDPELDLGDIVIPVAAVRDESTSDHYIDKQYPAVADFKLVHLADELFGQFPELKIHTGVIITTSSTFTESPDWGKEWSLKNVIAVDCETSVIYTLASLMRIPAINILVVSDHVTKSTPYTQNSAKKVDKAYDLALKVAYEVITKSEMLYTQRRIQDSYSDQKKYDQYNSKNASPETSLDW